MKAKVALNIFGLKDRPILAKYQTAITKCTGNADIGTANPTVIVCQASHDAAEAKLDEIDAAEQALVGLRGERDQLMEAAVADFTQLGSCVENKSGGDPVIIANAGFEVAGAPTTKPPVSKVLNLVLTHGDTDGASDAAWHRDKSARGYEVQASPDPMSDSTWVANQIATKSSCVITGKTVGSKLWVRVRALGVNNSFGLWSDPAMIIVS